MSTTPEKVPGDDKSTIIIITPVPEPQPPPDPPPGDDEEKAVPVAPELVGLQVTRDVSNYGWNVRIQGPFPSFYQMWCMTWSAWRKWWIG